MNTKTPNASQFTGHSHLHRLAGKLAARFCGLLALLMITASPVMLRADYDRSAMESGRQAMEEGNYGKAIVDLTEAIRRGPNIPYNYKLRGNAYRRNGEYSRALADYNEAVRLGASNYWNTYCLARLLATCPDDKIRDGHKAVELAAKICETYKWGNPHLIDTLAAAQAEVGNFAEAVRLETKVLEFDQMDKEFLTEARQRLSLYKEKKPYREILGAKFGFMPPAMW
jgi:tetratricopeptide (TPR) repeat protein